MRKTGIVLAAVAAFAFSLTAVHAAQDGEKKSKKMNGVLIDTMCGEKMASAEGAEAKDIQAKAVGHGKACALKCAKDGGLALMHQGKLTKLDEASSKKAVEYLQAEDHGTRVQVLASTNEDGTLALAEINPAKEKGAKDGEKKDDKHADHKH